MKIKKSKVKIKIWYPSKSINKLYQKRLKVGGGYNLITVELRYHGFLQLLSGSRRRKNVFL